MAGGRYRHWTAFRVAAVYAVVSAAYVLSSDRLLMLVAGDLPQYQLYQTLKGWAFIGVTALAIWLILRQAWGQLERSLADVSLAEDRLRSGLNAAGGAAWMARPDGQGGVLFQASGRLAQGLGFFAEEPVPVEHLRVRIHPDDRAAFDLHVAAIVAGAAQVPSLLSRVRAETGGYRWAKVVADASRREGGAVTGVALDVTDLQQAKQGLADVIEGGEIGTWRHDVPSGQLTVNDRWLAMLGHSRATLDPQKIDDWRALVHPEDMAELARTHAEQFATRDYFFSHECRMRHRDGHWVWVLSRGKAVETAPEGEVRVLSGVHVDISRRKALEAELSEKSDFLQKLTETSVSGIVVFDASGHITFANLEASQILDATGAGLVGRAEADLGWRNRSGGGGVPLETIAARGEVLRDLRLTLRCPQAAPHEGERVISVNAAPMVLAEGAPQVVCSVSDITERLNDERRLAQAAEEARHAALHDPLTGLPNRALFRDTVAAAIRNARPDRSLIVQVFLCIDQFQQVKDRFGPMLGDRLIVQVAERLDDLRSGSQLLARAGAEEFTLFARIGALEDIPLLTTTLASAFDTPFDLDGQPVFLTASLGASTYPMDALSVEDLWGNADLAMYEAKALGGNRCIAFTAKLRDRIARETRIGQSLQRAIRERAFELVLQPKVALQDGNRLSGAEVLCRCTDPSLTGIGPAEFMPVAERTGLIRNIDLLMIDLVGVFLKGLRARGMALRVSVNLSPESLRQADFGKALLAQLDAAGLGPRDVLFELTEGAVVDLRSDARGAIEALLARGYDLSADDFGTGYSSLSYLQRLRLKELKIDQSFTTRLGLDSGASDAIVRAMLGMAQALGLQTVAEGIDTEAQAHWLADEGCDTGQGYFFGRPMPPEEFVAAFLDTRARAR